MKAKSYDDLSKIAQSFYELSAEKQVKVKRDLESKIKQRQGEKVEVEKEIGKITKNLEAAKAKQGTCSQEIMRLSAQISTMLAFDQDIQESNGVIKRSVDESNKLGPLIAGLTARVNDLKNEISLLDEEIDEDQWFLKFYRLVPLKDLWNKKAVELIPILEEIWNISEDLNFMMHPLTSGQKILYPSNWEALERIPQFFLIGDKEDRWANGRLKDLWRMDEFKFERAKKRTAA